MNNKLNAAERRHLARVKALPCGLCGAPPVSEAHHIQQGSQWLCIPLCTDCHRGGHLGLHGQRRMWAIKKMSELDILNQTVEKLLTGTEK